MSEWTKEKIAMLRENAKAFDEYIIAARYNSALDEIDRLQSELQQERDIAELRAKLLSEYVHGQCPKCGYSASWPVCTKCGTIYPSSPEKDKE